MLCNFAEEEVYINFSIPSFSLCYDLDNEKRDTNLKKSTKKK